MQLVQDPFLNGALLGAALPLCVAFALAWLLRPIPNDRAGGLAVGLGFLAAYVAILGWPPFPPVASTQKLAYAVVGGLALGVVLDLAPAGARTAALGWPTLILAWFGWRSFGDQNLEDLPELVILWLAGLFVFDRLAAHRAEGMVAPTMLLFAGVGASAIGLIGATAVLSQFAAAIAAAVAGFLLWNWPRRRDAIGWSVVIGAGSALYSVAVGLVLFSRASTAALAVLLAVFAVGYLPSRMPLARRPVLGPVIVGAMCALPTVVAVAVASLTLDRPPAY